MRTAREIEEICPGICGALLRDWASGRGLLWMNGADEGEILPGDLSSGRIAPRWAKAREARKARTAYAAEVFTPSFACARQNEIADRDWAARHGISSPDGSPMVFTESLPGKRWASRDDSSLAEMLGGCWEEYVSSPVMESCCGEGPYMCSPYDTTDGRDIPVSERVGLLDRKLRLCGLFAGESPASWLEAAASALKACYAYEWQGDSLALARLNALSTAMDFMLDRFPGAGSSPSFPGLLPPLAEIISKNMVQMDGMSWCVPMSCSPSCEGCRGNEPRRHDGVPARVFWWPEGRWELFRDFARGSSAQDVVELF